MKPALLLSVFIFVCLLISCETSRWSETEPRTVTGQIFMVGNAPFERPALKVSDSEMYILRCSGEIEKLLMSNQGKMARVRGTSIADANEKNLVHVLEVTLVNSQD